MAEKISIDGKRELRWIYVGGCLVTYMEADIEFRDALWNRWLDAVNGSRTQSLMICAWGATQPSNQQWRRATKLMRERELAVAVVTKARHNSALAKAASWLGTNIKAFRWDELNDACDFAGIDSASRVAARAKVTALRDYYGPVSADDLGASEPVLRSTSGPVFGAEFTASSEVVSETHDEIQARLAEVQARLRSRSSFTPEKLTG